MAGKFKIMLPDEKSEVAFQKNACCTYDFTSYCNTEDTKRSLEMMKKLREVCKKWCFQLERGESNGLLHFQGRISLIKKIKIHQVVKLFEWEKTHWSITSEENMGNMFYVMKDESRVEGPWCDTDHFMKIPRDIAKIKELRKWQADLLDKLEVYDERTIHVVIDKKGNNGKSTLARYCLVYGLGRQIPFLNDYKELMEAIMDMPKSKIYFLDMPRACTKDKIKQIWGAIETVKGGYAFDRRYHWKEEVFDPPNICVFSNVEPDSELMSKDRWKKWEIRDDKLVEYGGFNTAALQLPPPLNLAALSGSVNK